MSIDRCSRCGDLVDTDDEPEAYVQVAPSGSREDWRCYCQGCREEREEQDEIAPRPMPANIDALIAEEMAANPTYSCPNCDWDVDGCSPCAEHEDH